MLLKEVREFGFEVGGIEVSAAMGDRHRRLLGPRHGEGLLVGEFLQAPAFGSARTPDAHLLERRAGARASGRGGGLPGPHPRASGAAGATGDDHAQLAAAAQRRDMHVLPAPHGGPRVAPQGIPTAQSGEAVKRAGFRRVSTPVAVTRSRVLMCGGGWRMVKQLIEPLVDRLPVSTARLLCRGFGMSCTIASK